MWDWWFAWHGSEAQRYKLWHPRAHMHAVWADGRSDLNHYVGRTSHVVEYVGNQRLNLAIHFVPTSSLGLDEARLKREGEVAICARGAMAGTPPWRQAGSSTTCVRSQVVRRCDRVSG
jgi:hypothetical protein